MRKVSTYSLFQGDQIKASIKAWIDPRPEKVFYPFTSYAAKVLIWVSPGSRRGYTETTGRCASTSGALSTRRSGRTLPNTGRTCTDARCCDGSSATIGTTTISRQRSRFQASFPTKTSQLEYFLKIWHNGTEIYRPRKRAKKKCHTQLLQLL